MMASMASTQEILRAMAKALDTALNGDAHQKDNGFVLLVFPFDGPEGARVNYVSNADRRDMIAVLKEITARLEGQAHTQGRA